VSLSFLSLSFVHAMSHACIFAHKLFFPLREAILWTRCYIFAVYVLPFSDKS
jgi:hypothetical protein